MSFVCTDIDDLRWAAFLQARAVRLRMCGDGYCGALDCARCHPAGAIEAEFEGIDSGEQNDGR
jgi:hypothetical protein